MMSLRTWPNLLVVCIILAGVGFAADKPNVVFIVVDDLACKLGCYGDVTAVSPNIDGLAKRSVRFDRAYCQYPICNASRASFLSGRYPETIRVLGNTTKPLQHRSDSVFIPGWMKQHGYRTIGIGKVFHEGDGYTPPGQWDFYFEGKPESETEKRTSAARIKKPYEQRGLEWAALPAGDDRSGDIVKADEATRQIEMLASSSQPFFLAVGFKKPHIPYCAPEEYFRLHPLEGVQLPQEPAGCMKDVPEAAITHEADGRDLSDLAKRESLRAYRACVTCTDAQIGRVLSALEDHDLAKNTIIVVTSDHGYHLNDHGGMWHKMSLFEASARVPLIVSAPNVAPASCSRPAQLIDLFPTLCELSGTPTHPTLEGRSLVPLLRDPAMKSPHPAYTMLVRSNLNGLAGHSVTTGEFRYIEWDHGKAGIQLYDSRTDWNEWTNLGVEPEFENKRANMRQLLHR